MILGGVACTVGASESLGIHCHPAIEIGEIMLDKRPLAAALLTLTLAVGGAGIAYAETVYYKGVAVNWDHGRTWKFWSYSDVNTKDFEHSATANSTTSGWKRPGVRAYAEQYVGTATATAYWDCR